MDKKDQFQAPRILPGMLAVLLSGALRLRSGWVGKLHRGGLEVFLSLFTVYLKKRLWSEVGSGVGMGVGGCSLGKKVIVFPNSTSDSDGHYNLFKWTVFLSAVFLFERQKTVSATSFLPACHQSP